ncbi:glycosyltransferase family 2 protein [Mangrovibacterium lignilyticum]|uniref:glycosyltransferase family 2 protein n=1 Tax=Mangrovibacterium lignilyticum TaxID=2668052 RepID=UPI0013D4FD6E|nr:glycosyltransferase family 2 protein [Mangrovibacterium lignilyticum]
MKVTIITVVYNNRENISECIESVLNQSYPNIEHIVIDGNSKDGTQEVISRYHQHLGKYISEKDKGLYDALNKGLKMATGDIVGILHSDDLFYEKETVQKVVNEFKKTETDLLYANGVYVPKTSLTSVKRVYRSSPLRKYYIKFGWIPLHTTIYIKRDLIEKYGLYDAKYSIASDYDISLRWFKSPEIKKHFFNEWVVKMRLGGKSTSANMQKRKSLEDLEIIKRHGLFGLFTLGCKIARKIPQYLMPRITGMQL